MTVYEGKIHVTFKEGVEEVAIYEALRNIGKHIKTQRQVGKVELFLKPMDWIDVNP